MSAPPNVTPGRDPWFDNGRWLAGSLVVMVHANQDLMTGQGLADWLHGALQPARIPLFALLVGLFTPRLPTSRDQNNLIRMVLVPFTLVSLAHIGLTWWFGNRPLFHPLYAQWTLWFMYSVIVWRLFGPLLARVRYFLVVAVLISLLAGAFDALTVFSLQLTLGYTPFFALGLWLQGNDAWLRRRSPLSVGLAIAAIGVWITTVTITLRLGIYPRTFVGMVQTYANTDSGSNVTGMVLRLLVLVLAGTTMLGVLHLMPRRRIRWISYIGAGGFTIYMLHGLVLRLLRHWDLMPTLANREWWVVPTTTLFAFLLAALLGSKPVRWLARPITRPKLNWILLQPPATSRSSTPKRITYTAQTTEHPVTATDQPEQPPEQPLVSGPPSDKRVSAG